MNKDLFEDLNPDPSCDTLVCSCGNKIDISDLEEGGEIKCNNCPRQYRLEDGQLELVGLG